MKFDLDTPTGHIVSLLIIFGTGVGLYATGYDYGKEIIAGALGALWTLLQIRRNGPQYNIRPENVNQADTISIKESHNDGQ